MKVKRKVLLVSLVLFFLMARVFFPALLARLAGINLADVSLNLTLLYQAAWYTVPLLLVMPVFYKPGEILPELGFSSPVLKGFLPALIVALPMVLSYAFLGTGPKPETIIPVAATSLFAGFFEELYFRGFVFGQLFRRAKWGFVPAVLANGIFFGLGHLYQAKDPAEALMVFLVTMSGAAWFSWLYIESGRNLWFIISLHFLMNLSWGLFSMADTAAGGWTSNIPRSATIVLSILYIVIFVRKQGGLRIRGSCLWVNRQQDEDRMGEG